MSATTVRRSRLQRGGNEPGQACRAVALGQLPQREYQPRRCRRHQRSHGVVGNCYHTKRRTRQEPRRARPHDRRTAPLRSRRRRTPSRCYDGTAKRPRSRVNRPRGRVTQHCSASPRRGGASHWSSAHEWWRWGESNPRPTVVQQDFSGCSSLMIFSAPASHANKDADGLSHLDVPGSPMTRDLSSGSLDDARNRGGSSPRADGLRSSLRRRGRSRCECYRHLLVRAER